MALNKTVTTIHGVSANYWKITILDVDFLSEIAIVQIDLFLNQAARDAGKNSLYHYRFTWSGDDFPFTTDAMDVDNPLTIAYNKIKQTIEFQGATDA
jgi:hypothetical protein